MIATLKALSVLLCYPTRELQEGMEELEQALLSEALATKPQLQPLLAFMRDFGQRDLYDVQERYVLLFDRTRSLSLHLFEHVHGESRERGQAMVNLASHYHDRELFISAREMPDYLPMFLEFASTLPLAEARGVIAEIGHILVALEDRLRKRGSLYAEIFKTLLELAPDAVASDGDELASSPDDDPNDLVALDRSWEDEPVTFGPGSAGASPGGSCPAARSVLARMELNEAAVRAPNNDEFSNSWESES